MPTVFTLDRKGTVVAVLLGAAVLLLGGNLGPFFLFDLLLFLVLSEFATEAGRRRKIKLGLYEKSRGWKNVAANGLIPLLLAVAYFLSSAFGLGMDIPIIIAYVASAGAVTADKFASEIGVLDGEPLMLLTMKKVKKGTSGAITCLGLAASLMVSIVIAASIFLLYRSVAYFAVAAVAGFAGSMVDSVLGYWEEKGIGNKYTTNIACAVSGAIICVVLFML